MTTPVTPVPDASLPLPDPADLGTWGARMAEMHRWMREDLRPGMNTLGEDTYTNAVASVSAANFVGAWSGLTGALTVPSSASHSGRVWLLLVDVADVTTETPGVSAAWQDITPLRSDDVVAKVGGAAAIPTWATAGRPASPSAGHTGFNTDLACKETWDGTYWVPEGWQTGAAVAMSGTSAALTGIPAWANEVVLFVRVASHNSGSNQGLTFQLNSVVAGYVGGTDHNGTTALWSTSARTPVNIAAASTVTLEVRCQRVGAVWQISILGNFVSTGTGLIGSGTAPLNAALTQITWAWTAGAADAGTTQLAWRK